MHNKIEIIAELYLFLCNSQTNSDFTLGIEFEENFRQNNCFYKYCLHKKLKLHRPQEKED
jgi:hypothetical protein